MSLNKKEQLETNVYQLEIGIDAKTFRDAVLSVYAQQKKRIAVPGFRKGKAPLSIIERVYGEDVFYEDALEQAYPSAIQAAYEEGEVAAVDSPYDMEVKEMGKDGVVFTVKVTTKPEVTLKAYKGLQAAKEEVVVEQADIDEEIDRMRERNARMISVEDRAAADGDIATIDFEGFVDAVAFEGGKGENHELTLGSGQFIPGFEEQIIGHNIGEAFDVNVTFPEEYAEELAGKDAVFKVVLHAIKQKELPELDDEFAKDLGEYETLADLRAGVKEDITARRQKSADDAFESALLEELAKNVEAEIPEAMFKNRAEDNTNNYAQRLSQQGMDLDTYLMYMGMDKEIFAEQMLEQAQSQVRVDLALEKIVELEKLEASPEKIEEEYQKMADMYSLEIEKVRSIVPEASVKEDITKQAAVQFVIDNAKVKKPAAKKAAKKAADEAEAKSEQKPAKKPAAKKPAAKKADDTPKAEAEKTEKKPAAKKPAAKTEKTSAAPKKPAAKKTTEKKAADAE